MLSTWCWTMVGGNAYYSHGFGPWLAETLIINLVLGHGWRIHLLLTLVFWDMVGGNTCYQHGFLTMLVATPIVNMVVGHGLLDTHRLSTIWVVLET